MAAPLRYPLILLAWGRWRRSICRCSPPPGNWWAARSPAHWRALFADPQLGQALAATLVSTLLSVGGALLIALTIVAALWPSARWRRLASRLPLLLAVPHLARRRRRCCCSPKGLALAAVAVSDAAGRPVRHWAWPDDGPERERLCAVGDLWPAGRETPRRPGDRPEEPRLRPLAVPALAGAARPAARPRHGAAGHHRLEPVGGRRRPGAGARQSAHPRRAGVAMVKQGDELQQAKGALASLLLMAILGGLALVAWGGWRLQRQYQPDLRGVRHPHPHALPGRLLAALLPLSGLLGALLLAGLARSAPPQMDALGNSLGLALAACALGAAVCLLWLACGPARGDGWVWLPLVLPALPLADGQYRLALYARLDGDWWTVLWGHLLWVVPWMLFILRPAWRQRDPRLTVVARTLGWGSTRIFWLLTLPSLTRPLLTARRWASQ